DGLRVAGARAIALRAAGAVGERLGAHAEAAGQGGGAEAVVGRDPAAAADRVAAHGRAGQGAACARAARRGGDDAGGLAVLEAGEAAGLRVVGARAIDLRAAGAIGERLGAHAEAAGHGGGAEAVVGREPAAAADRVAA